jgi:predicted Zn-dependent peptidase
MKASFLLVLAFLAPMSPARSEIAFEAHKTPSGLTFWHHSRPDLSKDALFAGWRDGVGFTTPGKEGLSFVGTRMIFRASRSPGHENIFEALRDIGADAGIYSEGWSTFATLTASADKFAAAVGLAGRILEAPLPEQKQLDRIESVLAESGNGGKADGMANYAAYSLAEPGSPMTRLFSGEGYSRITREDVEGWRKRVLSRDNLVVAVEGPTNAEDFGRILDDFFKALPDKSDVPVKPEIVFSAKPKTIVIESDQPQTFIAMYAPSDVRHDSDRVEWEIAIAILGGLYESRLYSTLRQKLGAAYDLHASLEFDRDHETLTMAGAVANDRAVEALAAVNAEYARWRAQGVTAEEFAAAASRVKAAYDGIDQRPGGAPATFVRSVLDGNRPNEIFGYEQRIAGLSAEQLNADIPRHFPAGPLLTVIVAPTAAPFKADCAIKSWKEVDKCP